MPINRLTELQKRKAKFSDKRKKLSDGGSMYLEIHPNGDKYWRMNSCGLLKPYNSSFHRPFLPPASFLRPSAPSHKLDSLILVLRPAGPL